MYLLGYELKLPGTIDRLSTEYPDLAWNVHPLGARWVVRGLDATGDAAERARTSAPASAGPAEPTARSFLYSPRGAERALLPDVISWGAAVLPPLVWTGGRLTLRLIVNREAPPESWRVRHPDARLLVKRRVEPGDLADLLGRPDAWPPPLTPRQSEVLLGAVDAGYYEVPRRAPVGSVAHRLGIARSTAEEHLRAAESILIRSIAPLVAARHRATDPSTAHGTEVPLEYFVRFSAELDLYVLLALRDEQIARVTLERRPPKGVAAREHPYLRRILRHIATGEDDLADLPVDLDVGAFDRRVLDEVRRIPPGRTRSYGEIARRIGAPRAARAVGNAVAKNPAVVVVPCHRVLPSSGGLGGYSATGGPTTKRRLLERERAPIPSPRSRSRSRPAASTGVPNDATSG